MDTADMRDISMAANRMNVAIYPSTRGACRRASVRGSPGALGMTGCQRRAASSSRLDTGGDAIVETNDFDRALRRVVRDSSAYYLIAYESPHPDDGKFHNVSVKVKRPRLTVRARPAIWRSSRRNKPSRRRRRRRCPAEVTAALTRLADSLRPDATEPAEREAFTHA